MRKFVGVAFGILIAATMASAQIPASGNIFIGYSFERTNWSGLNSTLGLPIGKPNLNGWEASLEGKVLPHVGIVTDFASHYGSQTFNVVPPGEPANANVTGHQWEVMFGPRLSVGVGKFTPFAEAMFGVAHIHNGGDLPSSSNTSFASAIGGGLDYRLIRLVAVRVEGDYLRTSFFSTTQNNFRLSTGVVFRF